MKISVVADNREVVVSCTHTSATKIAFVVLYEELMRPGQFKSDKDFERRAK
jgi:hypothetical protein